MNKEMINIRLIRRAIARKLVPVALFGSFLSVPALAQNSHDFDAIQNADEQWGFFEEYCTECHNLFDYSGGLDLSSLFIEDVPTNADIFEKVVMKLRGRMMPPTGQVIPSEERFDDFVAWMEGYLDEAGEVSFDPHQSALHRLNRKEYVNSIRDLIGIEFSAPDLLPEDGTADGFDNIASALQVSAQFIDQYVSAALSVMEQAIGDQNPALGSVIYSPEDALPRRADGGGSQQGYIEGMPLGTRGGILVEHWFPADGEYSINVADLAQALWVFNLEFRNDLVVVVDDKQIYETSIGGGEDLKNIDQIQDPAVDAINARLKDIRFSTTAGPHKVGVTFRRRTFAESDDRLKPFIEGTTQDRILSVSSFEIRGPYNPHGMSSTPSRDRIFSCYPESGAEEKACANQIINEFATKAYRRPVDTEDTAFLHNFYERGHAIGGFEEGIRQALTRALASPNFLYRFEEAPAEMQPGSEYLLDGLELASRLSFFLWGSIPDQELLDLAVDNKLHEPEVLEAQISRMLVDERSSALASSFAFQWLHLSKLAELNPDIAAFPYATGAADPRNDYITELEMFFDSVVKEDGSVVDLLDADYTFINEKVASLYDITTVKGNQFRRVTLEDSNRWGLLGKGAVLMVSSYPNRTSPVLRGAYILENIMGTTPPVPPPNVEDLAENEAGQPATTVRERLEKHRANPSCNACHGFMDPLGFALDNFDAVGRWRDRDRFSGMEMDASGLLPSGELVSSPTELRDALLQRPDVFVQAMTQKLFAYALGRTVEAEDMPTVRAIVHNAADDDYRFSSIIKNIINTHQFQVRKAPEISGEIESSDIALSH